jgi:3-oxoacyl-[acyl-carrier protein] reductase
MKIKDKNVIVTGGAGGLGLAITKQLLLDGARVCVLDRDAGALERLSEHPDVFTRRCDVTSPAEIREALAAVGKDMDRIHVLVNNAGLIASAALAGMSTGRLVMHSETEFDRVIAGNLSSVFYMTVQVVDLMLRKRVKGLVINVSSICAAGNPGQSAYSAAKAGVNALTATWAKELGPLGIRFAGLAPGYTDTGSTRTAMSDSLIAAVEKRIPLKRLGSGQEIVLGVMSLIENDYFHGKTLELDGGLTL